MTVQGREPENEKEYAGIVQLVEHLLAKEKVASSSLAARSFFLRRHGQVARQGSAKPSSSVQIRLSPQKQGSRKGFFVLNSISRVNVLYSLSLLGLGGDPSPPLYVRLNKCR